MLWFFILVAVSLVMAPFVFVLLSALYDPNVFHKMKKDEIDKYYDKPKRK